MNANQPNDRGSESNTLLDGLRDIDKEILRELAYATKDGQWLAPIDFGGYNGSPHSYVLSKLCRRGLAERKKRFGLNSGLRGSYVYRAVKQKPPHDKYKGKADHEAAEWQPN